MPQLRVLELKSHGDMKKTETWLRKLLKLDAQSILDKYGKKGVEILSAATPVRTGTTAASWTYTTRISRSSSGGVTDAAITWSNTNLATGRQRIPIVILIECGHGTRNGGYVPPNPFIKKNLTPLLNELAAQLWKEVENA